MSKALIVVDVQNDFCEGGSLAVEGGTKVAMKIADLLRDSPYDVKVATLDWHLDGPNGGHFEEWPAHCIGGTEGAAFKWPLDYRHFHEVFLKGRGEAAYSGFEGTGYINNRSLKDYLQARFVTNVDVVGIALDYCVKATALDALKHGFKVAVLENLTAYVDLDSANDALKEMREAGATLI